MCAVGVDTLFALLRKKNPVSKRPCLHINLPDTICYYPQHETQWFFTGKRDNTILRKNRWNVSPEAIFEALCSDPQRKRSGGATPRRKGASSEGLSEDRSRSEIVATLMAERRDRRTGQPYVHVEFMDEQHLGEGKRPQLSCTPCYFLIVGRSRG